jgi:hypothetical protein
MMTPRSPARSKSSASGAKPWPNFDSAERMDINHRASANPMTVGRGAQNCGGYGMGGGGGYGTGGGGYGGY